MTPIDPATQVTLFTKVIDWILGLIPRLSRSGARTGSVVITPFTGGGWPFWSYGTDERGAVAVLAVKVYVRNTGKVPLLLTNGRVAVVFPRWWKPYARSLRVPPMLSSPTAPFHGLGLADLTPDATAVVDLIGPTIRPAPRESRSLLARVTLSSDLGRHSRLWVWLPGSGNAPRQQVRDKSA